MITDINHSNSISPNLRPEKLEPYWDQYFHYRKKAPDLHSIIEEKLASEIEGARSTQRPYIDSQQVISRVLTELGPSSNFHRQFGELFPHFRSNQVLGMQLYALMAADEDTWIYSPTQHAGHHHQHATYFKSGT